jgi:hypothetical protein
MGISKGMPMVRARLYDRINHQVICNANTCTLARSAENAEGLACDAFP